MPKPLYGFDIRGEEVFMLASDTLDTKIFGY